MDALKCPICWNSYHMILRRPLITRCCGNTFCSDCWEQWLAQAQKQTCPVCRQKVKKFYVNVNRLIEHMLPSILNNDNNNNNDNDIKIMIPDIINDNNNNDSNNSNNNESNNYDGLHKKRKQRRRRKKNLRNNNNNNSLDDKMFKQSSRCCPNMSTSTWSGLKIVLIWSCILAFIYLSTLFLTITTSIEE